MYTLPIQLNVENREVVVFGGGEVGTRKVNQLMPFNAKITVVSPVISSTLESYFKNGIINWKQKKGSIEDIEHAFLIILATNDASTREILLNYKNPTQLLNDAVKMEQSDFHIPGIVQRGPLTISVSTNGASPSLTKKIKYDLLEKYDERYEEYIEFLRNSRQLIFNRLESPEKRREILKKLVEEEWLDLTQEERMKKLQQFI